MGRYFSVIKSNVSGLLFVGLIVFLAMQISTIQSIKDSTHLAATAFAILLGIVFSPLFFRFQHILQAGVQFSAKKLLRFGIVLYGFNITLNELLSVGLNGFLLSLIVICSVFLTALILGVKVFKLDIETSMLVGAGSAICGAAAVLALESVLKSDAFKGILAVGSVVIFGLIFMFAYPFAFYFDIFASFDANALGLLMGATLHEVANVAGAAEIAKDMGIFSQNASNLAIIIKMMRVILLVPFLLIVAYIFAKNQKVEVNKTKKSIAIPYFAFFFLGVIVLNTALNAEIPAQSAFITDFGRNLCTICIVFAMAALGLQINLKKFLQSGFRVFALAFCLGVLLSVGGYFLILAFRGIMW